MLIHLQYIPINMHTVFALLCFVVVMHWLIFPYPSGLLHWHCGNLTIAPVPAKQPRWIWVNTSCEFIMNDCITTTKQSTTKPCAYFLGYTVWTLFGSQQPVVADQFDQLTFRITQWFAMESVWFSAQNKPYKNYSLTLWITDQSAGLVNEDFHSYECYNNAYSCPAFKRKFAVCDIQNCLHTEKKHIFMIPNWFGWINIS